ncbi:MAG: hypothetical protein ABJB66_08840 [Gemmatimonadaceae bacterium]
MEKTVNCAQSNVPAILETWYPGQADNIDAKSLASWNESTHAWVVENGPASLDVDASSANLRAAKTMKVTGK